MLRILLLCICALLAQAYLPTALPASKVAARASPVEMGARRPVKKAAAKKPVARKASGTKGKGGILPWVTNEPGTYAEVINLSEVTLREAERWIGSGSNAGPAYLFGLASKMIYPANTRK
mmetsp:Transcript_29652/g.88165  ORF Transcript_29652/g.88165 Transcript_29652/m.88165 type:complete len:120 (-) Transcript_29652:44-403(-)